MKTKELYKWALKLAMPIMVQNLISTLVNTADTVMLGFVGQTEMAASSLANQYIFVLFCAFYGVATATSVMCAQYWGKGDKNSVEKIIGIAIRVGLCFALVFSVVSFVIPSLIMRLFTDNYETIAIGSTYLRILSVSLVFFAISQVYLSALKSIGKVVFPSVVSVASLIINIAVNATFIFGLFGMPRLGVTGVALGTVIARVSEAVMCMVYSARSVIRIRIKYLFAKFGILTKDFFRIGMPAIGNDMVWSLATSVFMAILGRMGDDIIAANAVAVMVVNVGAIAMRGFANSTTIVIGQTLGSGKVEDAKKYSGKLVGLTALVGTAGCIIILALRPFMMNFYSDKITETAVLYLGSMMLMTTYRMIGEGVNTCLICGCFRGGGDTRYGLIMDFVMMWLVCIPLMLLAAYVWHLPPIWVYFVMTLDEIIKMPFIFIHFFRYKWLINITRDIES